MRSAIDSVLSFAIWRRSPKLLELVEQKAMDPPDVELTMEPFPQMLDHPARLRSETTPPSGMQQAHLAVLPQGRDTDFPTDLTAASTRELRILSNRIFQLLDTAFPSSDARERYDVVMEELERRELEAARSRSADVARETFRDNALFSRFELYRNGDMVGYVQYTMRGGDVYLLHAVIDPRFRRLGLERVLMRAVFLDAHRRRLAVLPFCPEGQDFLNEHPQFLSLIPSGQRRRFTLLRATRDTAADGGLR